MVIALGVMSPGPDFLAISYSAAYSGRTAAGTLAAGITVGNVAIAIFSALGLISINSSPSAAKFLYITAGIYFSYIGIKSLSASKSNNEETEKIPTPDKNIDNIKKYKKHSISSTYVIFLKGLLTALANMKAVFFYISAINILSASSEDTYFVGKVAVAVFITCTTWYGIIAFGFSIKRLSQWFEQHVKTIQYGAGFLFTAIGFSFFVHIFNT